MRRCSFCEMCPTCRMIFELRNWNINLWGDLKMLLVVYRSLRGWIFYQRLEGLWSRPGLQKSPGCDLCSYFWNSESFWCNSLSICCHLFGEPSKLPFHELSVVSRSEIVALRVPIWSSERKSHIHFCTNFHSCQWSIEQMIWEVMGGSARTFSRQFCSSTHAGCTRWWTCRSVRLLIRWC